METKNYHISITIDATPNDAFKAISSVSKWWTENVKGSSEKPEDEFTVQFGDVHFSRQKLVEVVPDKKVVWLVIESKINFVSNKQEWSNTTICFEIVEKDGKTEINFTHIGLVPEVECYNSCSNAWGQYIKGSLFRLLTEGEGKPERR